jgi:hypothetical protein
MFIVSSFQLQLASCLVVTFEASSLGELNSEFASMITEIVDVGACVQCVWPTSLRSGTLTVFKTFKKNFSVIITPYMFRWSMDVTQNLGCESTHLEPQVVMHWHAEVVLRVAKRHLERDGAAAE